MKLKRYQEIISLIKKHKGLSKHCNELLTNTFPDEDKDTLFSIVATEFQKRMKIKHVKTHPTRNMYYDLYSNAISKGESPGIILRLAERFDVTPCLIAKLILQKYFEKVGTEGEDTGQINVNTYMRDTTLIMDPHLSYEVFLCTIYDDLYSPIVETIKHSLGQQYEIRLNKEVTELGFAFRNEEDLRRYGYDKTPDIKLDVPVAVDGFVITWIESKALFADAEVHADYMKVQYLSYWNRFGPGLIIYWFDFLETIVEPNDKRFIIRNHLPKNVIQISSFSSFIPNDKLR